MAVYVQHVVVTLAEVCMRELSVKTVPKHWNEMILNFYCVE